LVYLNKGDRKLKSEEQTEEARNVVSLIADLECPDAKIISELINLRRSYMDLDVTSLMVKAYLLGTYDGTPPQQDN
jgi:hypothetical protein